MEMFKKVIGVFLCAATPFSFNAAEANAQPNIDGKAVVCDTFDKYGVNMKSVKWIGDYLMDSKGQTAHGAVTIIQIEISLDCPWHSQAFDQLNDQLEKEAHPGNPFYS
jgi:hypothetical protein